MPSLVAHCSYTINAANKLLFLNAVSALHWQFFSLRDQPDTMVITTTLSYQETIQPPLEADKVQAFSLETWNFFYWSF